MGRRLENVSGSCVSIHGDKLICTHGENLIFLQGENLIFIHGENVIFIWDILGMIISIRNPKDSFLHS